mmetsp:Transcript_40521/g.65867  ORF Transcript_40521/g.65867 Transcript_40521/m.65867 type:complete len:811 (-) Transcript_40521:74-2506(-)
MAESSDRKEPATVDDNAKAAFRDYFRTRSIPIGDERRAPKSQEEAPGVFSSRCKNVYEELQYDLPSSLKTAELEALAIYFWSHIAKEKLPPLPSPITKSLVSNAAECAIKHCPSSSSSSRKGSTLAESEAAPKLVPLEFSLLIGVPLVVLNPNTEISTSFEFLKLIGESKFAPESAANASKTSSSLETKEMAGTSSDVLEEEKAETVVTIADPDTDEFVYEEDPPSSDEEEEYGAAHLESKAQESASKISSGEMWTSVTSALVYLASWWESKHFIADGTSIWSDNKNSPLAFRVIKQLIERIERSRNMDVSLKKHLLSAARNLAFDLLENRPCLIPSALDLFLNGILPVGAHNSRSNPQHLSTTTSGSREVSNQCKSISRLCARATASIISPTGCIIKGAQTSSSRINTTSTTSSRPVWEGFNSQAYHCIWSAAAGTSTVKQISSVLEEWGNLPPYDSSSLLDVSTICCFLLTPTPWHSLASRNKIDKLLFKDGILQRLSAFCATFGSYRIAEKNSENEKLETKDSLSSTTAAAIGRIRWALLVACGHSKKVADFVAEVPGLKQTLLSTPLNLQSKSASPLSLYRAEIILWSMIFDIQDNYNQISEKANDRETKKKNIKMSRKALLRSFPSARKSRMKSETTAITATSKNSTGPRIIIIGWKQALKDLLKAVESELDFKEEGAGNIDDAASSESSTKYEKKFAIKFQNSILLQQLLKGLNWTGMKSHKNGQIFREYLKNMRNFVRKILIKFRSFMKENKGREKEENINLKKGLIDRPRPSAYYVAAIKFLMLLDAQLKEVETGPAAGKSD